MQKLVQITLSEQLGAFTVQLYALTRIPSFTVTDKSKTTSNNSENVLLLTVKL